MKKHFSKRLLSLVLAVSLCLGLVVPAAAAGASDAPAVTIEKVDNSAVSASASSKKPAELKENESAYAPSDVVRVSIVLEKKGTIEAGYSPKNIAGNSAAMAYRSSLEKEQAAMAAAISKATRTTLDVVWNLTLAANIISANVRFGDIEAIEAVDGVAAVLIETRYEPCVVKDSNGFDPNMATSSQQIGSGLAYLAGYTGAGSRIAIIDTGTDIDHKSFDAEAYEYALSVLAEEAGMELDEYIASLNLLDAEEIASVADQLNAANPVYINSKLPYGYNYVDRNTNVIHLNDGQGEHGSHVAGIATANSYVSDGQGGFERALDAVYVQGVAPDAQLLTMKVFGQGGGAYDSDYMVAIEDAIVLNCDAVNLSLGSGNPGSSRNSNAEYQAILDSLVDSGVVVSMSAGNAGYWAESAENGLPYLYLDDVSMQMDGTPGSFTNSMAVASVDNDGFTIPSYILAGDSIIEYYDDSKYGNKPLTTIAGTHEFVLLNNIGTPEQWDALGVDLTGKIAICFRGQTSFFEKANAAVEHGAIGVIIINNTDGLFGMDLTGYKYTVPCVSVAGGVGAAFAAAGTAVTGDGVNGWTGTLEICDGIASGQYNSAYYTMSVFSSWGIPGSLELKPEITAPGGNIYSVAGANVTEGQPLFTDHASYETMSGTSMAAPQIAGMSAVLAQYVREEGLAEKTGLNERTLIQSLLMSTAVPMRDAASGGNYYPVIQQGAGLANVGLAVMADSYILMGADATASYADGKVKAELGDDPAKSGVYTFSFTINNLTEEDKNFVLSADVFTQDCFSYSGIALLDTWTAPLYPAVTWTANGQPLVNDSTALFGMDFNADGVVNNADGQALLDYATGVRTELPNTDNADIDNDGDIDSHDAYLFLSMMNEGTVPVAANGSTEVTVTIALTAADKQQLAVYPNGAYIEAYVYAESLPTAEGVAGTRHSIPVIGFYGNWSDASMFDKGSYVDYAYGLEGRPPYLYESNYLRGNYNTFTVRYPGDSNLYHFGGNPMMDEAEYLPERNSISSVDGPQFAKVGFTAIRRAADSYLWLKDVASGGYYLLEPMGEVDPAYYYANAQVWQDTYWSSNLGLALTGIPDGTALELGLTLVPEYYLMDGEMDMDTFLSLGEGASFSIPMVVDNTAPTADLDSAVLNGKTLTLDVSDNRYVSAVAFFNATGTSLISVVNPNQTEEGATSTVSLDLTEAIGKTFLMQVYDFAMNVTTYKVSYDLMPELDAYYMFYDMGKEAWYGYSEDGSEYSIMGYSGLEIYAGEYVDGYVFVFDANNDLYVMPDNDFANTTFVAHAKDDGPLSGEYEFFVSDMAYNPVDKQMYFLAYSDINELYYPYLYTVDLNTGAVTLIGEMGEDTWTLAIDDEGNFYGQDTFLNILWKYTVDTYAEPENLGVLADELAIYMAQSALAWDSQNQKLVFTLCVSSYIGIVQSADIYLIDPTDLSFEKLTPHENLYAMVGTYVRNWAPDATRFAPTDEAAFVTLSASEASLLGRNSVALSANVLPWNLTDRSVTWSSSDESVAVVNANGVVSGVGSGVATITATSAIDPTKSASCEVTVTAEKITITGILQDEEGYSKLFVWDLENSLSWQAAGDIEPSMTSATYDFVNQKLIVMDSVEGAWNVHVVDPATGKIDESAINPTKVPLWDMEYSSVASTADAPKVHGVFGYYFFPEKDPFALDTGVFNLASFLNYTGASYLTAITSAGYYEFVDEGVAYDTEWVIMLDNAGYLWHFWIYDNGENAFLNFEPTDLDLPFEGNGNNMFSSMVIGEDGNLYVSAYTGNTNEVYRLVYNEAEEMWESSFIGDFGEDVWPAILLSISENGTGTLSVPAKAIDRISAEVVSAEELRASVAAPAGAPAAGSLNSVVSNDAILFPSENTTTLTLTAMNSQGQEVATTNGVQTVTYDTTALKLVGIQVNGDFISVNRQDEAGKVTIGYVDLDGIPAGAATATLTFEVIAPETSVISVAHEEANDDDAGYTENLTVNVTEFIIPGGSSAPSTPSTPSTPSVPGTPDVTEKMNFADVKSGNWYYDAVEYVFENGLMNGVSDTTFAPNAQLTRAMMWTILARMDGVDTTGGAAWYTKGMEWAIANGISDGTAHNDNVTREQVATMLYRFAGKPAVDGSYLAPFSDASLVSAWADDAMNWAVSVGLIKGDASNKLNPTNTASRAEIATMIFRYLEA